MGAGTPGKPVRRRRRGLEALNESPRGFVVKGGEGGLKIQQGEIVLHRVCFVCCLIAIDIFFYMLNNVLGRRVFGWPRI